MKRIIAICGKSSSGKDSLMKKIKELYPDIFSSVISYTTRPKRDNEVEGKDYFFVTDQEMAEKIANGIMLEAVSFNGWVYGSGIDSLSDDKINIGVYNLEGIDCLLDVNDIDMLIFYIVASGKTRLLRSLNREQNPDINEIIRRYGTDEKDFEDLDKNPCDVIVLENETEEQFQENINKIISLSKIYFNIDI